MSDLLVFLLYLRGPISQFCPLLRIRSGDFVVVLRLTIKGSCLLNKGQEHPNLVGYVDSAVNIAQVRLDSAGAHL